MELGISVSALNAAMCDSEQDLVERAKRDGEAFAALYRAHRQAIARYIYRRVGDVHATEDLVADVFMIALQSLPRFRSRGVPIRAWFYRIATNRVNRWARRERGRVLKQLDAEPADPKSGSSQTRLTPNEIRKSRADENCRIYFGAGARPGVIIMVVVDVVARVVKTAHLAKKVTGGASEWSK